MSIKNYNNESLSVPCMRAGLLFILFLAFPFFSFSQGIAISTTAAAPSTGAGLDINFPDKGLLPPRVTLASSVDLMTNASLTTGLFAYRTAGAFFTVTSGSGYYYWNGAAWTTLGRGATTEWGVTGNAGTSPATNIIGTTDAQDFVIKTNNTEKLRISSTTGNVGIGVAPSTLFKLMVDGSLGTPTMMGTLNNAGVWMMGNTGVAGDYRQGFFANLVFDGTNWVNLADCGTADGSWGIGGSVVTAANSPNIRFHMRFSSGGTCTNTYYTNAQLDAFERMRIDKDGNWEFIQPHLPIN